MQVESTSVEKKVDYDAKPWLVRPGQVLNPAGRQKGSRNKLRESFISMLQKDWEENGEATIARVRDERPHEYLKVVASLLPKQIEVKEGNFDGYSDEQIAAIINAARSALNTIEGSGTRIEDAPEPQQIGKL